MTPKTVTVFVAHVTYTNSGNPPALLRFSTPNGMPPKFEEIKELWDNMHSNVPLQPNGKSGGHFVIKLDRATYPIIGAK